MLKVILNYEWFALRRPPAKPTKKKQNACLGLPPSLCASPTKNQHKTSASFGGATPLSTSRRRLESFHVPQKDRATVGNQGVASRPPGPELRISWYPMCFSVVWSCRGTLPQKRNGKRAPLGDLVQIPRRLRSVCFVAFVVFFAARPKIDILCSAGLLENGIFKMLPCFGAKATFHDSWFEHFSPTPAPISARL